MTMATIKSYTDLEQSKKLAEILPLESADMSWVSCDDGKQKYYQAENRKIILMYEKKHWIPCWSLAALLSVFPYYEINNNGVNIQLSVKGEAIITEKGEYLLDLAVNMIIRLNELNLL